MTKPQIIFAMIAADIIITSIFGAGLISFGGALIVGWIGGEYFWR